jgi:hypothetical protein
MQMAMARSSSGLAYPERFYAAASYAGFDGSHNSTTTVSSKFQNDTALLLYALYQQVTSPSPFPDPLRFYFNSYIARSDSHCSGANFNSIFRYFYY